MTGVTTGQTALPTCTDSDDTENYLTVSLVAALQALANLFESGTGHDHSGSGKGKPIASAGLASGITLTSPQIAGTMGIGGAPTTTTGLLITGATTTTGTGQYGLLADATSSSAATVEGVGIIGRVNTAAAAFTMTTAAALRAENAVKGAGSTITTAIGVEVKAQTAGGANNIGVDIAAPSGGATLNIGLRNAGTTLLTGLLTATGGITIGTAQVLASSIALTNNAGAQTGTLTNAPIAGNPTKWVQINDNGTLRSIPAW